MKIFKKMFSLLKNVWSKTTGKIGLIGLIVLIVTNIDRVIIVKDAFKWVYDTVYKEENDRKLEESKQNEIHKAIGETRKNIIDSVKNSIPVYPRDNVREIILESSMLSKENQLYYFALGGGIISAHSSINLKKGTCITSGLTHLSHHDCQLKIYLNEKDNLVIDFKIYDKDRNLVGVIEANNIILNKNRYFTYNMDDSAIEIIDNSYDVIFHLEYIKPNIFIYQGILFSNYKEIVLVINQKNGIRHFESYNNKAKKANEEIKKLFKYTGNDWLNKRAEVN